MNARAIAPGLALLMLVATLPTPLGGAAAEAAVHPQMAAVDAAGNPGPAATPQGRSDDGPAVSTSSQGHGPAVTIGDEKMFTQSVQAAIETVQEFGVYDNPAELERVTRIGYELAQHADFTKYPITFALIDEAVPNSEALPGGQIFVTRGMLDLGLNDDMMACLLGHEITHVIKEHYLHISRRAMLMSILSNVLVAGLLISQAKNPPKYGVEGPYDPRYGYDPGGGNRVQGAAAASLIASELMLRSYSRDNEDEADVVGQRLAAAAGYDPDGARQLWVKVESEAQQIREYGYLQTHPFHLERMRAAEARKGSFSIQPPQSAAAFRLRTQEVLVAFAARQRVKEAMTPPKRQNPQPRPGEEPPKISTSVSEYLYRSALVTWPRGATADSIRLASLHKFRDSKIASCPDFTKLGAGGHDQPPAGEAPGGHGGGPGGGHRRPGGSPQGGGTQEPNFRVARIPGAEMSSCAPELHDYGAVVRAYRKELTEMAALDPTGPPPPLATTLNREIADLEAQRRALYPRAAAVWNGSVYETAFLVSFLSNFPEAPEAPQVALALGDAYSRTGNEAEAVTHYMTAWKAAPESASGKRALTGLRNLTGNLKNLAALQELANQDQDLEMKKLAGERLASVAKTYDDVANGAEYLRRFPAGGYVIPVLDRLNVLADNLYGEVVLYQGFGDVTKAAERINKILTNAPLSPAAAKLRDRAVLVAEKS
jgi:Zn-dependent protease with chaperone function